MCAPQVVWPCPAWHQAPPHAPLTAGTWDHLHNWPGAQAGGSVVLSAVQGGELLALAFQSSLPCMPQSQAVLGTMTDKWPGLLMLRMRLTGGCPAELWLLQGLAGGWWLGCCWCVAGCCVGHLLGSYGQAAAGCSSAHAHGFTGTGADQQHETPQQGTGTATGSTSTSSHWSCSIKCSWAASRRCCSSSWDCPWCSGQRLRTVPKQR